MGTMHRMTWPCCSANPRIQHEIAWLHILRGELKESERPCQPFEKSPLRSSAKAVLFLAYQMHLSEYRR